MKRNLIAEQKTDRTWVTLTQQSPEAHYGPGAYVYTLKTFCQNRVGKWAWRVSMKSSTVREEDARRGYDLDCKYARRLQTEWDAHNKGKQAYNRGVPRVPEQDELFASWFVGQLINCDGLAMIKRWKDGWMEQAELNMHRAGGDARLNNLKGAPAICPEFRQAIELAKFGREEMGTARLARAWSKGWDEKNLMLS